MAEIIAQSALAHLPLKAEAISHWNEETDLGKFLVTLFDQPCVITAPDGTRHESNYSDYGWSLFEDGCTDMKTLAEELSKVSVNDYHQDHKKIRRTEHDFLADDRFGKAAKSIVAWNGTDSAMLSEGVFVSIHHTLEAGTDLDCSVELLKSHYYKQAGYCLRAFIENVTLPLYFSKDPEKYTNWKKEGFRIPSFRGKDGLLNQLVKQNVITQDLSGRVDKLYDKLNAFVHSSVGSMIHSGHETGEWRGLSFKLDEVHNWCDLFAECVDVGIHLAKIQSDIWLMTLNSNPDICTICHSENNFEKKQVRSAGKDPLFEFVCKQCGHKWHRSQSLT